MKSAEQRMEDEARFNELMYFCGDPEGDAQAVKDIFQLGDEKQFDSSGCTLLHLAAEVNNVKVLEYLISQVPNIDLPSNQNSVTPLGYAAWSNSIDAARLLIKAGANLNTKFFGDQTSLHLAAQHDRPEMIRLLVEAGADIESMNSAHQSPLHEACSSFALESAIELHRLGADISARDAHQKKPEDYCAPFKAHLVAQEIEQSMQIESAPSKKTTNLSPF